MTSLFCQLKRALGSILPKLLLVGLFIFHFFLFQTSVVLTQDSVDDELSKKRQEIEQLEKELDRVRGEKQTLASTLEYLDNKIKITEAQIYQTEKELEVLQAQIQELTQRIGELDITLEKLSRVLLARIKNTYKRSRIHPFISLLASNNLSSLLSQYKYLKSTQRNDRLMLYELESIRTDFDNQKTIKEEKQAELDQKNEQLTAYKTTLGQQQQEKEYLLILTQNDERRFQEELNKKLAELEAIQSIIAGKGDETEVGKVSQGDRIASVIPGPSTCSSGGHLHFEVARDNSHLNPADFLSPKEVVWDNAPDTPFSFNGSWPWPINDPVRITQGYGMTFYAATMRYYGGAPHTGIDMINKNDYTVKAVKPGTLYRGAVACRGGSLRYVKVDHAQDNYSTYYLHVNY